MFVDLVADGVSWPAVAVAARVSPLHHEVRDDAVEALTVEVVSSRETLEAVDRQRRIPRIQRELHDSARRLNASRTLRMITHLSRACFVPGERARRSARVAPRRKPG